MDFYHLLSEIELSDNSHYVDEYRYSFNDSNRKKLCAEEDTAIFDIFSKIYMLSIKYNSDRDESNKQEYVLYEDSKLIALSENDKDIIYSLDWNRLPLSLKAYAFDYIWIANHDPNSARIAAESYYTLYQSWFDTDNWVACVDCIYRAVELVAKLGDICKKDYYLGTVYQAVIETNGTDKSFFQFLLLSF